MVVIAMSLRVIDSTHIYYYVTLRQLLLISSANNSISYAITLLVY